MPLTQTANQILSPLGDLRPGQSGVVVELSGPPGVKLRLLEMGLTPGIPVRVIRLAPLGDPIEIQVRDYRLSLRRAEAARVKVVLLS